MGPHTEYTEREWMRYTQTALRMHREYHMPIRKAVLLVSNAYMCDVLVLYGRVNSELHTTNI